MRACYIYYLKKVYRGIKGVCNKIVKQTDAERQRDRGVLIKKLLMPLAMSWVLNLPERKSGMIGSTCKSVAAITQFQKEMLTMVI